MLSKIEKVLDELVRPDLYAHGGDVAVSSFSDGILRVRLLGQCSGCPSAYLTTESLIEAVVTAEIPEVKQVVLVQEIDQELLAQALAFLRDKK